MKSFLESFKLQFCASLRSRTLLMLSVASVAWMFLCPNLMTSDGTADGAHRIFIRYSLGTVFCLLAVCLSTAAARALPVERSGKRLSLTLVKPVRPTFIALGRIFALTSIGAIVLVMSAACAIFRADAERACYHVLAPKMESPSSEAEKMYDVYMSSPTTPAEVKRAKKSVVVRLLTQKAFDRYETVETNSTAVWEFDKIPAHATGAAMRMRFTNLFETRDTVSGVFKSGSSVAVVSNITQSVLSIPFDMNSGRPEGGKVTFKNEGGNNIMMRPRRDIHLLYSTPSTYFAMNLVLAVIELVCILATVVSFALFLGAGLGQSVAVFTVVVTLFLSSVSASIIEEYPDQLETDKKDRIGLFFTRCVNKISSPVASFNPIESLVEDEFIGFDEVRNAILLDLIFIPFFLSLSAGFVMQRKQDGN